MPGGQQTPWNPLKEIDELYCKDTKVPLIDLEVFAREHIKSVEEQKFNREMGKLQKELDQLESGKYSLSIGQPTVCIDIRHKHSVKLS